MSSRSLLPRFVFINSSWGAWVCRGSQCWALFLYQRCQDHRPVVLTYYVTKTLDPIQFFYQCRLRDEDAIIHLLSCFYTHLHQLTSTARLMFFKFFQCIQYVQLDPPGWQDDRNAAPGCLSHVLDCWLLGRITKKERCTTRQRATKIVSWHQNQHATQATLWT